MSGLIKQGLSPLLVVFLLSACGGGGGGGSATSSTPASSAVSSSSSEQSSSESSSSQANASLSSQSSAVEQSSAIEQSSASSQLSSTQESSLSSSSSLGGGTSLSSSSSLSSASSTLSSSSLSSSSASSSADSSSSSSSSSLASSSAESSSSLVSSSASSLTSSSSSSSSPYNYTLVPSLESLLPSEPNLPSSVCTTLSAELQQTNGLLPDSVDADPANSGPDTARIQAALNGCPSGQAVKLVSSSANNAFLAGRLTITSGVTLWVDGGVTLFASRSPADYDNGSGNCGDALSSGSSACNAWITASNTSNSGLVGEGIIDGRGGSVLTSGNHANKVTWWDLSIQSKSSPALSQNNPRMIQVSNGSNFTFYKITIQNAPKFHVGTSNVDTITAWGIKILTPTLAYSVPEYSCGAGTFPAANQPVETISTCFIPELTKNTDGFDPGTSKNVTVAYSFISVGDDNIAVKSGGSPASQNHLYAHNRFFYGHGMSIGSETDAGVDGVKVWDLVVDGQDSSGGVGLRIKTDASRGGEVMNVSYDKVCMRRVKEPMIFSPYYSSTSSTAHLPNIHDITLNDFHYSNYSSATYNKGTLTFSGFSLASPATVNPLTIALNNVVYDTAPSIRTTPYHDVQFTLGPGTNLSIPSGTGITSSTTSGTAPGTYDCSRLFIANFPSANSPI